MINYSYLLIFPPDKSHSWAEKRDSLNLVIPENKEDLGKLVDVYRVLKHLNKVWSLVESFVLQDPSIGELALCVCACAHVGVYTCVCELSLIFLNLFLSL